MAKVEWIRINTGMFENKKIKYIRKRDNGNDIVLIWTMLLTMAGSCNDKGKIYLTETIPYTVETLADELHFEENIVKEALELLQQLDMIYIENDFIFIVGWEEHQNADGLDKIREQTRKRVAKHRNNQKNNSKNDTQPLQEKDCNDTDRYNETKCNVTSNVTVTQCNATEKNKNRIRIEEEHTQEENACCVDNSVDNLTFGRNKNVKLSMDEVKELKAELGEDMFNHVIRILDEYIQKTGKVYSKPHSYVIRNWVIDAAKEERQGVRSSPGKVNQFNNFSQRTYSEEQMEELEKRLLSS